MLSTSTLNPGDLPNDIELLIGKELSLKDLCYFGSTSKRWHPFFQTDKSPVWRDYYERHFGKLKDNNDIKEQTIAAYLYHEANSARRADDKQRLFCHLFDYLTPFRQEPAKTKNWALPYFIRMYGHGYGVRQDTNMAANYLRQSFHNGCQKAAVLLAELLEYPQLLESFKKETENITALLKDSYQSGEHDAAKQLGNLYSCLIDHKDVYKEAYESLRQWYLQYYSHGFDEGLDRFMDKQMYAISNMKALKEDIKIPLVESIRQALLTDQNTHPNSAIIAFYLAVVNQYLDNDETAMTEFERAATLNPLCHRSRERLHRYYQGEFITLLRENPNNEEKIEATDLRLNYWRREKVRTGEVDFLYMVHFDKKIEDDLDDIKVAVVQNGILTQTSMFNNFYPAHVYSSMSALSNYYIASWKSSEEVNSKVKSLVWLAFLSQCGCAHATDMIFKEIPHDETNATLLFAKGLIALYGIITHINEEKRPYFTEGRSPDREQALEHFHKAQTLRPTILEDYLNIAENEHPLLMSEGLKQSLRTIWKTEIVAEKHMEPPKLGC